MQRQPPAELATWRAFQWANSLITKRIGAHLRAFGLTLEEFDVLIQLYRADRGTLPLRALHDSLLFGGTLTRSGLTRLLDRFERDGVVSRTLDQSDRRRFHVTLTKAGVKQFEAVWPEVEQVIHACFVEPLEGYPTAPLDGALTLLIEANG